MPEHVVDEFGRTCRRCFRYRAWKRFVHDRRRTTGRSNLCVECHGLSRTCRRMGIEPDDYDRMFADQGGVCALCGEIEVNDWRLCIDHDHHCCATGCRTSIRGLLCRVCNRLLGLAELRPAITELFADYLRQRPLT